LKKKLVVSLMVLLMVFAVSGSAFAEHRGDRDNNSYQWGQTQYPMNSYTQQPYQQNIYQLNPYGMNVDQTNPVIQQFFLDLPQNHWAYKMIKEMKKLGVINGDFDGKFYPERQVTRAEFATMLVRALHLPISQGAAQTFTDVPTNFWGYNYIEAAQNYLTGYQSSAGGQLYFNPQDSAVREDIIVALVRAEGLGNEQPDLSVLSNFVDADKISYNLKGYVAIAIKHDLVKGSTDQMGQYHLYPQNKLTRAEAAAFLNRIIKVVVGQQPDNQQDTKVIVGQQPGSQTQQAPVLSTSTVNGATLTLTYNENLDTSSVPSGGDFIVKVNGTVQSAPTGITVSGSSMTMTLYQAVPSGSTVTISYTPGTHPLRDLTGNNATALVNYQVSNGTSGSQQAPVLVTAVVNGATMTLTYNENLDTNSVPYSSDFIVRVNGTVQSAPTGITVSGSSLTLALYQAVASGSTVTISYTPGTHPLRDLTGYNASALVNYQVSNGTTDTISPVWPQGSALNISNLSGTGLTLSWPQATDNVGVATYRIYQDSNLLTTVTGSVYSYNVMGLSPNTNHTFRVDAGDTAGNWTTGPSVSTTTSN